MNKSMFSAEALQKAVESALPADAKKGEKVLVGGVDESGAQVVASFKFKDKWEIQAAARHEWGGDNKVGAKVLLRW